MTIKCEYCGKYFEYEGTHKKRYCSKQCRVKGYTERKKEERKTLDIQEGTKQRRKKTNSITEIAIKARAAGMTYGQYVAAMEMREK